MRSAFQILHSDKGCPDVRVLPHNYHGQKIFSTVITVLKKNKQTLNSTWKNETMLLVKVSLSSTLLLISKTSMREVERESVPITVLKILVLYLFRTKI